jgi:small-conductance mechanosensitive channel
MGEFWLRLRVPSVTKRFAIFISLATAGVLLAQTPQIADSSILDHLNGTISWYRQLAGIDRSAGQPSDVLYLSNARDEARQAVQLAFQAAQSISSLQDSERKNEPRTTANSTNGGEQSSDQQGLANALQGATDRLNQDQAKLTQLETEIPHSPAAKRKELISQRDALQGVISLDQALQEQLQKISTFVTSNEQAQGGLAGQVAGLKQSVPEVFSTNASEAAKPAGNTQNTAAQDANVSRAQSSGLVGQSVYLLTQTREIHKIDNLIAQTNHLRDSATRLQKPLRDSLRALVQQGRSTADTASATDAAQIAATQKNLQHLTGEFKQMADAAFPLRQEIVLLDGVKGNLEQWRDSMLREYTVVLRSLLTRVFVILVALGLVAGISSLWRRATLRYVQDARRRRQLLIIRRFVSGFLMMLVILLGFVSEFSSLATFAGFITAGIAVALQTVILSVAAYFTLIGRRGIRAGDRITLAGVTGDVLEIGLVRLHLMELGGTGIDLYPTGRVVVFSNSVLFGATPLYKQLPGTSYAWHELALTLSPDTDPASAQLMLTNAANSVYSSYRKEIDRQHAVLERVLDTAFPMPQPSAKWQFTDTGLELSLRYPVLIDQAAEIDDQMTREIMRLVGTNQQLKAALSGPPKLRAAIRA